ncbi:MAG: glycosyltransferase family 2 protein [Pseudomonadota bacterium]
MLISIVTAVRNRAETIAEAVASVQGQSHPAVEHVVQDGGSTDGTLAILRSGETEQLRLASEPDSGIYDAINRGMARTSGEVIGLVHSDDFLASPQVLAHVAHAFAADSSIDAVYGDLDYVTAADTARIVRRWRSEPFTPALLIRGWMPPHPALFVRRRVIEQYGAYDTSFRISADYDAVLRWFSQPSFRAVYIPEVFVKMRTGGASNASLRHILRKSREDYRALRQNGVGGAGALFAKNVSKLHQFVARDATTA